MIRKAKNVTVIGADHFIASHLVEQLVRSDSNVKAFIPCNYQNDLGSLAKLPVYIKSEIEVLYGNLTNPESIDYAVKDASIVFHFGVFDMLPSHTNARDYLEKTVIGTFNVLNAARRYGVEKLVHISTDEVYGDVEDMPISEDSPLEAHSPHNGGDIGAEKLVEGYFWSYSLPVAIARLSNTYGPVQSRSAIVPTIVTQALVRKELLLGNMNAIRDFVYVKDVVQGLIKIAEVPETVGEAINLGSGQGISIGKLADKIVSLLGKEIEILFDATRIRLQDSGIRKLVLDTTKAKSILGWQPETSLDDGLRQTIEWFFEQAELNPIKDGED
jgi:nucleoside-diphosphate-sugar epimerase